MDEELRPQGCKIAQNLRNQGRSVDMALDSRRLKWAFKVCVEQ